MSDGPALELKLVEVEVPGVEGLKDLGLRVGRCGSGR